LFNIAENDNRTDKNRYIIILSDIAFSALTLLAGRHEEYPACENWVTRCWRGLSEARFR